MNLPIVFRLENVMTWGLEVDYRYGGYKLPLILKDFPIERDKISIIAESNNIKSPFYGKLDTIYLRVYNLTKKQEKEILYRGKLKLNVVFSLTKIDENKRGDYFLHFVVTDLGKVKGFSDFPSPRDI